MDGQDRDALIAALRDRGIADGRVLDAIATVPREAFVSEAYREEAYLDTALPIPCHQTISQPFVVAYMTERLRLTPQCDVLEIGTGSGYQAAILAMIARHVYTMERHEALRDLAVGRFEALGIGNITAIVGDGMAGWPEQRTFDRILVTAAASEVPDALIKQLSLCGAMLIPLGTRRIQHITLVTRTADRIEMQKLLPVRFVPLLSGSDMETN